MQFSKILFAILPALALAQDSQSMTTVTSTTTLHKTITLSAVHTGNATATASFTRMTSDATATPTEPAVVEDKPGAGSILDARAAVFGAVGMVVVAML